MKKKEDEPRKKDLLKEIGIVIRRSRDRDFPSGPVVRTPHFHCRELGFDP